MVAIPSFDCLHEGDSSTCPLCREIRQIHAASPTVDRPPRTAIPLNEELLGRADPAFTTLEGAEDHATRKTRRTSYLEEFPVQRMTRNDRRSDAREALLQLFSYDESLQALRQWGPMTDRQERVLDEFLWGTDERLSWTAHCERIAEDLGCSRQTVSRDLDGVIDLVARGRGGMPGTEPGRYTVTRDRGSRRREVWVARVDRVGAWSRSSAELVTDRATRRRALQAQPASQDQVLQPIPTSVMRQELAELSAALLGQDPVSATTRTTTSRDRLHNLRWARRRLQTARRQPWPRDLGEIVGLLERGCPLCRSCHTPILVGCCVRKRQVTTRRLYCDDACQMKHDRRKRRTRASDLRFEEQRSPNRHARLRARSAI